MSKSKNTNKKKSFKFPSAFSVLLGLMVVIALATYLVPQVKNTSLSELIMAPVNGMIGIRDVDSNDLINEAMTEQGIDAALTTINDLEDPLVNVWNTGSLRGAIDVSLFVLVIGGFLGVVSKTGALDAGVGTLVKKLKGREFLLIPILMFIFSLGGTTYGMAEETLAFYALLTVTMMKAGFDPLVATAIIMLGAGAGVLGSTINPFSIGAAVSAADAVGVEINQGIVIAIGVVLWFTTLGITIFYVLRYAKKVYGNKAATLQTPEELDAAKVAYENDQADSIELTKKRKVTLWLFVFSFLVMVISVIPWSDFGIHLFDHTSWLNGTPLGEWWFPELTIWFFLVAIIVGVVYGLSEKDLVDSFVAGAADMIGVAFIIGISRGISFMMANTGLDLYILDRASAILSGVSGALFANMSYFIYLGLSFLIPSTSGLASVSIPIFAPLAERLSISPEIVVSAFAAGSGLVNLLTPTSGVVMGGLAISKVGYGTWLKFIGKLLLIIFIANIIILSIVSLILS